MTSTPNQPRGPLDAAQAHDDPAPPTPNLELLRKHVAWVLTQDRLPAYERKWDQNRWATYPGLLMYESPGDVIAHARSDLCNTYRCLAGNIVYENGTLIVDDSGAFWARAENADKGQFRVWIHDQEVWAVWIEHQAQRLLGIDNDLWNLFDYAHDAANIRDIAEQIAASVGETL